MTIRFDIRHLWLYVIPLAALAVAGVNVFGRHGLPQDPDRRIAAFQRAEMTADAERELAAALDRDSLDLDLNYRYINNHFEIKAGRNNQPLLDRYQALAADERTADLGHYCLGLIFSREKDYKRALDYYDQVLNRHQKYLNNSVGYALMFLKREDEAEIYLHREIELAGNIEGAVSNLVNIYLKQKAWKKLDQLARAQPTGRYVATGTRRYLAFRQGDLAQYLRLMFVEPLRRVQLGGVLAALLIGLTWFVYFWRIDIFEQEPLVISLAALILGGAATFLTFPLGDGLFALNAVKLNGQWLNDLIYSVLHIGVVEEAAKFLPVVLVVLFSRQVNEPVDLVIYGSLSALGFATLENVLYFTQYGLHIAYSRFLTATVLHMSMTGFISYCWAKARYIRIRNPILPVLGGFALAAVAHGLYDYFILGPLNFGILSIGILLLLAVVYGRIINNCLNFSPFFKERPARYERLSNYSLMFSAAVVLLVIGHCWDNFNLSTTIANHRLWTLIASTVVSVLIVFTALNDFKLSRETLYPLLKK